MPPKRTYNKVRTCVCVHVCACIYVNDDNKIVLSKCVQCTLCAERNSMVLCGKASSCELFLYIFLIYNDIVGRRSRDRLRKVSGTRKADKNCKFTHIV